MEVSKEFQLEALTVEKFLFFSTDCLDTGFVGACKVEKWYEGWRIWTVRFWGWTKRSTELDLWRWVKSLVKKLAIFVNYWEFKFCN